MLITAVRASWLRAPIPAERAHVSDFGRNDSFNMCLVEVETDAGLVGLGEAKAAVGNLGHCAAIVALIREKVAPVLIGRDPRDITSAWELLYNGSRAHYEESVELEDGYVLAPTRPGLGLTLRRDFVRQITVPA